jgi:hypothetical protein
VVTDLNAVRLTWNSYACANAQTMYIYRKEGPSAFVPGPCQTGIPPEAGYALVRAVPAGETAFLDENVTAGGARQGLERGKTYCYRIYAGFPLPAGGASIASQEACVTFAGRAAQLTNVDVEETSTGTGRVLVRWTRPRPAAGGTFTGTPRYVVSRAEGLAPAAAAFVPVRTLTSLADTSFVDTNLNTQDVQYTYRLEFVRTFDTGQLPVTEAAAPASSVRVAAVPNAAATALTVRWTYQVPWDNAARPVVVYRRTGTDPAAPFVEGGHGPDGGRRAAATSTPTRPWCRGQTYCYYVRTEGRYPGVAYLDRLFNKSQVQCAPLIAPPCTPVLRLAPLNCDSLAGLARVPGPDQRYANRLAWAPGRLPAGCEAAVAGLPGLLPARAHGGLRPARDHAADQLHARGPRVLGRVLRRAGRGPGRGGERHEQRGLPGQLRVLRPAQRVHPQRGRAERGVPAQDPQPAAAGALPGV